MLYVSAKNLGLQFDLSESVFESIFKEYGYVWAYFSIWPSMESFFRSVFCSLKILCWLKILSFDFRIWVYTGKKET